MPRQKTLALFLAALVSCASAQAPTEGHIAGKSYVSTYFHVVYTWPAMLKPVNLPGAPANPGDPKAYAFPLFTARQGNQPYGVVVVAEKLNVAGPHSQGIKTSADFIDRIEHTLRPGPILSNITRSQKKNALGRVFDVLNYQQSGKPSSVIATQAGQYLLVFKCNAQSAGDMVEMENSALSLRNLK